MTSQHAKNKLMLVRMTELEKKQLEEMAKETGRDANDMLRFLINTSDVSDAAENHRQHNLKATKGK